LKACASIAASRRSDFSPVFQGRVGSGTVIHRVASATVESVSYIQPSLTRREQIVALLFRALKDTAKFNSPLCGGFAHTLQIRLVAHQQSQAVG
jgi:hypothetical protein